LAGCTVAPGFEFSEFELADPQVLQRNYPAHRALIARLGHRAGR
jgi:predicted cupin superfamily sugar epimerase